MDRIQRFRIDGVLGEGGMGTVYRAYDPELERAVAIKVLTAPSAQLAALDEHHTVDLRDDRPRTEHDLLAEARMMAAISHPNVLPVFEIGRLGDKVFLVMELIDGIDLRRWIGTHTVAEILAVLVAAARGLAAAHARGIVHGDLKPDNILIGSDGRVCVADFGVSAFVKGPRASLLRIDDARGTPAYLAPEVWRGDPITPAADVYAFATTAAEALLGERLDDPAVIAGALARRGVPVHVRDAIMRGLAREPIARPVDLVAALAAPVRRRRWVVPAILGAAIAVGATLFVATRMTSERTCVVLAPGVWSDTRIAELHAKQIPEAAIAPMAKRFADLAELRARTCQDQAAGSLGSVQARAIDICLDRLVIEYDERVRAALIAPKNATELLGSPPTPADCRTRRDTQLDPVKQRAVIARLLAALFGPRDALRGELDVLVPLAVEAGDHELAARISNALGGQLAVARDLVAARKALLQARAYAQQAGSAFAELRVVTDHLRIERFHDELASARLLANDAKVLIERVPEGTPYIEKTLLEIATLAAARGEYVEARDFNRRLLDILEATDRGRSASALERRIQLVKIAPKLDEPSPAGFKQFVEDTHALLDRIHVDKTKSSYRTGLFAIAEAYRLIKDPRGDQLWNAALDRLRDEKPEPGDSVIAHRAVLAGQLYLRDREDEAIAIMYEVVRESSLAGTTDITAAKRRYEHLMVLALMLFTTGQAIEAHAVAEDALLEVTGKVGPTHRETRRALDTLISIELHLGDLPRAEKHLEQLDRAVRSAPAPSEQPNILVMRASLARLRGELALAEKLAREALTTMSEIKVKDAELQAAHRELGRVLLALGRHAEALPALVQGLPQLEKRGVFDCVAEIEIAKVERILGKRSEGDARARACLVRMKRIKGFARQRAEAEAWLAAP